MARLNAEFRPAAVDALVGSTLLLTSVVRAIESTRAARRLAPARDGASMAIVDALLGLVSVNLTLRHVLDAALSDAETPTDPDALATWNRAHQR